MSRKSYPNVNAANQYARDVVRGKIVACQFVIQACQRHLDDLMAEKSKSFRYRFDKDLAERAAKFIQLLPHTKGEWAFKRMPITLEPWQLFVICCAFGWVNKGTRLRRFREVYTEIPRKNGKSAISAGVALYCFACDNEFGAEVYSGATTEKQAWEVFRPARLMCKRTPMLTEAFGIEVNASNMNRPEDGARFEPLIGNPGDGSSPHCAVVDEYHEHATDALYTTMLTGMGARRQPLMWAITTAGYNIEGPCYDKRREVIEMLNGSVPNDELFGIIYTVDEGDDWTDPQVLEKANPNIGVSVYREFLLSQQQRAKNNARLANVFKTKHLNIWVSARSAYFNLVSWQSCEDKSLTLEQFEGQPCILAFDLARKLDMNSMARLYTREIDGKTHYYSVAPRFWVPYDTVYSVEKNEDRRTAERFQKWVETLNGKLSELENLKSDLEKELLELKRPAGGAQNKLATEHKEAFVGFLRKGREDGLRDLERKALQVGTDEDGGYAVPEELDRNILNLLKDEVVMRQEATVITVGGSDYKKLVNLGGTASGWVGETDTRSQTATSRLELIEPLMGEIYGNPQATQKMLDDAFFNVEAWINSELATEFAEQEEIAFTSGDGTKKPKGFLAYESTDETDKVRAFGKLQHIVSGEATGVTADAIIKLIYTLRKAHRTGAKFMMNNNSLFAIRLLKDTEGNYLWRPGLELGQPSSLAGYGIAENEQMPDIAADAKAIAFGNFKRGYTIVDRIGTRILRDPYTNKPFVGFYTTKRTGGMLVDSQAIKLLKIAAA